MFQAEPGHGLVCALRTLKGTCSAACAEVLVGSGTGFEAEIRSKDSLTRMQKVPACAVTAVGNPPISYTSPQQLPSFIAMQMSIQFPM